MMSVHDKICKALCKSGKFETGQGTCSPICMDQLGEARKHCSHREQVFSKLAEKIIEEVFR